MYPTQVICLIACIFSFFASIISSLVYLKNSNWKERFMQTSICEGIFSIILTIDLISETDTWTCAAFSAIANGIFVAHLLFYFTFLFEGIFKFTGFALGAVTIVVTFIIHGYEVTNSDYDNTGICWIAASLYIIGLYSVISLGWLAGTIYVIVYKKEKKKLASFFMTIVSCLNLFSHISEYQDTNYAYITDIAVVFLSIFPAVLLGIRIMNPAFREAMHSKKALTYREEVGSDVEEPFQFSYSQVIIVENANEEDISAIQKLIDQEKIHDQSKIEKSENEFDSSFYQDNYCISYKVRNKNIRCSAWASVIFRHIRQIIRVENSDSLMPTVKSEHLRKLPNSMLDFFLQKFLPIYHKQFIYQKTSFLPIAGLYNVDNNTYLHATPEMWIKKKASDVYKFLIDFNSGKVFSEKGLINTFVVPKSYKLSSIDIQNYKDLLRKDAMILENFGFEKIWVAISFIPVSKDNDVRDSILYSSDIFVRKTFLGKHYILVHLDAPFETGIGIYKGGNKEKVKELIDLLMNKFN